MRCVYSSKKKKNACKLSALTQSIYYRLQRLDHFFWEEINTQQEFCRVNSLQCLWRLHSLYGERMHRGYLPVNIVDGGCLLNPGTFFCTSPRINCGINFNYLRFLFMQSSSPSPRGNHLLA